MSEKACIPLPGGPLEREMMTSPPKKEECDKGGGYFGETLKPAIFSQCQKADMLSGLNLHLSPMMKSDLGGPHMKCRDLGPQPSIFYLHSRSGS